MSFLKFGLALAFASVCVAPSLLAQQPTRVALAISSSGTNVVTVKQGTVVTLTATVTVANGASAAPPGQVNFCEVKAAPLKCTDIRLLGTAQISSAGTATFKFAPGPGSHTYQAQFLGTHAEAASSSSNATLSVTFYYPTTTSLTSSGSTGNYTLTATVTTFGSTDPPTGTISFHDASNADYLLGTTSTLVPGPATQGLDFAYSSPQLNTDDTPLVAVADLNGDGKPDMAVTHLSDYTTEPQVVNILLGNGDGTFLSPLTFQLAPVGDNAGAYFPVVADVNGDGKLDMALPIHNGTGPGQPGSRIQILLGNGDGTFTPGQIIPFETISNGATGDFNGDGIPDLAVGVGYPPPATGGPHTYTVTILLGNGDGTFTAGAMIPEPDLGFSITVGDFNGDGKADLAIPDTPDNTLTILLGNGDGTFTPSAQNPATGRYPAGTVEADFNGDGILDLAVLYNGNSATSSAWVSVLFGNGDGTFTPGPQISLASLNSIVDGFPLLLGDFNGDGKADLALQDLRNDIVMLFGNGDGTFSAPAKFPSSLPLPNIDLGGVADFNGDGVTDLAVGNIAKVTYTGEYPTGEVAALLSNFGPSATATATITGVSIVGTGGHTIDASYSGDNEYRPSTSPTISLTAEPVPTTLVLSANPASTYYGQQVVLTAVIAPTSAQDHTASGTVTFTSGSVTLGTATASGGVAILNVTALPVGSDPIVATYSGDTNFAASQGNATANVIGYSSTTALTTMPSPAGAGQMVSLAASVAGVGSAVVPSGTVTFYDGSAQIGSSPLDASGHATYNTSSLSIGSHSLIAVYSGDARYLTSASAAVAEVIVQPDFSIALAKPAITLGRWQNTTTTVTLTSVGAFSDTVTLACADLPTYLTCQATPSSTPLTPNGVVTASLYLDTDSIVGGYNKSGPLVRSTGVPALLGLLLIPIFPLTMRRRPSGARLVLMLLVALPMALTLVSCAGNEIVPVPAVAPGTYVIPVTATDASTGVSHTAQLTLTVSSN